MTFRIRFADLSPIDNYITNLVKQLHSICNIQFLFHFYKLRI
jgi:hypothetical protein